MNNTTRNYGDEELNTCIIPENFVDTGRCFNGMFRTRNLIEGLILAVPIAHFLIESALPVNQKIVLTAVIAGGILIFFINGLNGDSVTEFIINVVTYNKKMRVAKYNPRVKSEATPGYLTKEQGELPRDRLLRIIGDINKNVDNEEDAVSRDIYDPMYQEFFTDDLGFIETPDDLKSKRELRNEANERKRKEKELLAKKKQEEKAAAIENKKKAAQDKKNGRKEKKKK